MSFPHCTALSTVCCLFWARSSVLLISVSPLFNTGHPVTQGLVGDTIHRDGSCKMGLWTLEGTVASGIQGLVCKLPVSRNLEAWKLLLGSVAPQLWASSIRVSIPAPDSLSAPFPHHFSGQGHPTAHTAFVIQKRNAKCPSHSPSIQVLLCLQHWPLHLTPPTQLTWLTSTHLTTLSLDVSLEKPP